MDYSQIEFFIEELIRSANVNFQIEKSNKKCVAKLENRISMKRKSKNCNPPYLKELRGKQISKDMLCTLSEQSLWYAILQYQIARFRRGKFFIEEGDRSGRLISGSTQYCS